MTNKMTHKFKNIAIATFLFCAAQLNGQNKSILGLEVYAGATYSPFSYEYNSTISYKSKNAINEFVNQLNKIEINNPIGQDIGVNIDTITNQDRIVNKTFSALYGLNATIDIGFFKIGAGIGAGSYNNYPLMAEVFAAIYPFKKRHLGIHARNQSDLSMPIWSEINSTQLGISTGLKVPIEGYKDIFLDLEFYYEILDDNRQMSLDLVLITKL